MWQKGKWVLIIGLLITGKPLMVGAELDEALFFTCPTDSQVKLGGSTFYSENRNGHNGITVPSTLNFPLGLEVRGPLGGVFKQEIKNKSELAALKVSSGLIEDNDPNPETVTILPSLCPRIRKENGIYIYAAQKDPLNHIPTLQMTSPDAWQNEQVKTFSEMDGKNVLMIRSAKITYDYEDSSIIDYEGPNPMTGNHQIVHEGTGGFYANFHVAAFPYAPELESLDRQTLLHLVQGRLEEIGKNRLRPAIRTESFLPGPFLSKGSSLYEMCEWGDTAHQAPTQKLNYENLAIWDWDYSVRGADHILLVIFESDEEAPLIKENKIPKTYMTDDIVAIFEIHRNEVMHPLTLKNQRGDFEISLESGNMEIPPKPLVQRAFANAL